MVYLAGGFALLITFIVIYLFNRSIAPIAAEYESNFLLSTPNLSACATISVVSLLLGLASAYLALSKSTSKSNT